MSTANIPDFTPEKLQELLDTSDPKGMVSMNSLGNPIAWYQGWTQHFNNQVPDKELHPVAYAAMLESWRERVTSSIGYHWASVLFALDGKKDNFRNIDTRNQTLLYEYVKPEWIYGLIKNKIEFEDAYLVAHPDGVFPEKAIVAYFEYRSSTSRIPQNLVPKMAWSLRPNMAVETHQHVLNYLKTTDLSIWLNIRDIQLFPAATLLQGFLDDIQPSKKSGGLHSNLESWKRILPTVPIDDVSTFRKHTLYAITESIIHRPAESSIENIQSFCQALPPTIRALLTEDFRAYEDILKSGIFEGINDRSVMSELGIRWVDSRLGIISNSLDVDNLELS